MSVPVRPDHDHDLVISGALYAAAEFIRAALAEQPAEQEPVGYWDGEFSKDGGATLYEVPQVSAFGRQYRNVPLYPAPQPAKPAEQERDGAMNALCKMFHHGEEVESDDGMAMLVPLDLWHDAIDALDSLTGEDEAAPEAPITDCP